MGAKELDVVITVIAVILVIMLWIMLYDSNRFVVRHYPLRDQRIKKSVKAVVVHLIQYRIIIKMMQNIEYYYLDLLMIKLNQIK